MGKNIQARVYHQDIRYLVGLKIKKRTKSWVGREGGAWMCKESG